MGAILSWIQVDNCCLCLRKETENEGSFYNKTEMKNKSETKILRVIIELDLSSEVI